MVVLTRPVETATDYLIPAREGWATYPAVAVDGDGVPWVSWVERLDGADSIWLVAAGGEPHRLAQASAIKDGPALAWTAAGGLSCAWQSREGREGREGRDEGEQWRLAVATHAGDRHRQRVEIVPLDPSRRPSHPVLVSGGTRLALACELHGAGGSEIVLLTHAGGGWITPVVLSRRHAGDPPESAYDPALAITPDGTLLAAWVEARQACYDVWVVRAPLDRAGEAAAWSAPECISAGPHFPAAPRLLASGDDLWVAWSNYSGGDTSLLGWPWANGPERRWERILFQPRRRIHVRRWDGSRQGWGPEWREPEPPPESTANPAQRSASPNSHWPVLFPLSATATASGEASDGVSVGLLCRRAVQTFRWTVEAHRLRARPDGRITWSEPAILSTVDGSERDRAGGNMPVAVAAGRDGRVVCAWQRHDRARTAPGFHFTLGTSHIVLASLPPDVLPKATSVESLAVGAATPAPALIRAGAARRTVTVDGETCHLVFGNLHRHAECSSCGRDANGPAEIHMRHAPDVNRNEFLAVTDHGEHLNDGEWREQCLLADFYTWPGSRVALPGIEWTSEAPWHPPAHGHKNIIFSRSDLPFVDCWMPHSDHPDRLWAWLEAHDPLAVTIPHHTMRGKAPTLWEHRNDTYQPVVEIFQDTRGSAEWLGVPAATSTTRVQGLGLDPRGSIRRALDRGFRIGFIASSDHGGVALGGLYVKEISREGILEALRARRCFATTGDRLLLDFRINGVFQGGELTLTERPSGPDNQATPLTITLRAEVLRPVQRIVLVRDGVEAEGLTPDTAARDIRHTWQVEGPFIGTSYFYVRLESADGELAWSSPIWVTRDWGLAM